MVLLRCVDEQDAEKLMHDVHDSTFGTHASGHTMSRKLLRAGYYWMTMEWDCYRHAKRCHKCQIYAEFMCLHILSMLSHPHSLSPCGAST
jgi:hypothetical protein